VTKCLTENMRLNLNTLGMVAYLREMIANHLGMLMGGQEFG